MSNANSEFGIYASRFPEDRDVSADEAREILAGFAVPAHRRDEALRNMIAAGFLQDIGPNFRRVPPPPLVEHVRGPAPRLSHPTPRNPATTGAELSAYASMLPVGSPLAEPEVVRRLRQLAVPDPASVVDELAAGGHLVRNADGSLQRPLPRPARPEPSTRNENPEFAGFRQAVRDVVEELLRERGLTA